MFGNLLLDYYAKSEAAGCCPGEFYALVFNQQTQALKDNGSGVLTLQNYTSAGHNGFAQALTENAQRTRYYSLLVAAANLNLAATPADQKYTMEYWRRIGGGTKDRSADTLLETRDFTWSGSPTGVIQQGRLDAAQLDSLSEYLAQCSVSFDSDSQVIGFVAWLERGGILQADVTQVTILWINNDGSILLNTTQATQLAEIPGVFNWSESLVDLVPDKVTTLKVTITKADASVHSSITTVTTWD